MAVKKQFKKYLQFEYIFTILFNDGAFLNTHPNSKCFIRSILFEKFLTTHRSQSAKDRKNGIRNVSLHKSFFQQLKSLESTKDFIIEEKIKDRIVYGELRVKEDRPKSVFEVTKNKEVLKAQKECIAVCETIMGRIFKNG